MNPSEAGGQDDVAAVAAAAVAEAEAAAVAAAINASNISNNNNNSNNSSIMTENPVVFLQSLISSSSPNKNGLQQLSAFASSKLLKQQQQYNSNNNNASNVAALFLQAAALHLPAATATIMNGNTAVASSGGAAAASSASAASSLVANVMALGTVASTLASMATSSSNNANNNNNNEEAKMVLDIVEAIGHAVTMVTPRNIISDSGILPVLRQFIPSNNNNNKNSSTLSALSPVHVEFLQACIFAGQYHYAQRCILHGRNDWPRPSTSLTMNNNSNMVAVTVQHVLRYYYLRGIVHMACHEYLLSRRCFWICCTIPSELCSAICIAAWKKLVLVTCRIQATADTNVIAPLQLPQAAPQCLVRFLSQANATMGTSGSSHTSSSGKKKQTLPSILSYLQQQDPSSPFDQDMHDGIMGMSAAAAAAAGGGPPEESSSVMHMVDVEAAMMAPEDGMIGYHQQQQQQQQPSSQQQQQQPQSYPALGVSVYAQLTAAFGQGDYSLYQSLMQQHGHFLQSDGNLGLAMQIQQVLRQRQVYLWSRVYSEITTLELTQLLQLANVQETLELLVQMSLSTAYGPWPVQIHDQGRIVVFPKWNVYTQYHDDGSNDEDTSTDNETMLQDLMVLTNMMQQLDATLAASAKFQSISARISGGGGGGGAAFSKEMSLSTSFLSEQALSAGISRPRGVEDV